MNLGELERCVEFQWRHDRWQAFCQHCLARARWTNEQYDWDTSQLSGNDTFNCQFLPLPLTRTFNASRASRFSSKPKLASRFRARAANILKAVTCCPLASHAASLASAFATASSQRFFASFFSLIKVWNMAHVSSSASA